MSEEVRTELRKRANKGNAWKVGVLEMVSYAFLRHVALPSFSRAYTLTRAWVYALLRV